MTAFKTLLYDKKNGVAFITLNRPRAMNAFNVQMRDDLYEVLNAIRDDPEVRVAILNGSGDKAFCAGADLGEFLSAPSPVAARDVRFTRDVWGRLVSIPQPLIAALHGYVLGSGIEIALCCDIRIASEEARLGMPEVGLGIIPAAGGTQTLPRAVGRGNALELLLTNRWIGAEEACRIGLVNRVVKRGALLSVAGKTAAKIAACHPNAVRYAKEAIVRGADLPLGDSLALEKRLASRLAAEAVSGVAEKHPRMGG